MYDLSRLGSPVKSDPSVSGGKILTLRMGKAKAGPVVSDNGNFIVDAPFPREMMKDPKEVSFSISTAGSYQSFGGTARADARFDFLL
jgi:ribose 5-phosphate isomerase